MDEDGGAIEYRELLDRVPAIIYIADPGEEGRWHYVSPELESILGFTQQEWRADPGLWARRLHAADRPRVLAAEASTTTRDAADLQAAEYRLLHRDGRVVWIRDDARLVTDEHGRMRWYGVLSDITERKQDEAELSRRAAEHAAVARLGEHALERVPLSDLVHEAVVSAAELLEVEAAALAELLPDGRTFRLLDAVGWPEPGIGRSSVVRSGPRSHADQTLSTRGPVVVTDWRTEARFDQPPSLRERDVRSGLAVAVMGPAGPFGVLSVHASTPREYSPSDVDFFQSLANVLADALERQATEEAIEHRAMHDALTGLPNRVLFLDRLEHALRRLVRRASSVAAVLFIDLDHFKLVNDSMGHAAGDELLAAVAVRLKQAVRPSDTVARFGGDEFGLLLEEIAGEREAAAMAERIAAGFARPFVLAASEHFVTASIGIALAQGGERPDELIRDADAAMYRAKERGRARYELFDEVMRGRAIGRLRIENDLRRAYDRDELWLAYQPILSLREESLVGVEALIRWNHPERGLVMPAEFIAVAEESGQIERIGRWVLESACRQAAEWSRDRPDVAPLWMAVNLSPLELAQPGLAQIVSEVLRGSGLDPAALCIEITETLLLEETEPIRATLHALKAIGVRLALDDFGTGYSSLSYLTRLPLDGLKVDRRFVQALGTGRSGGAITEAIIAMARALSLQVVGEGPETWAQVDELRRMGCDLAQGHVFSAPVPAPAITAMLRAGPRAPSDPDGL